MSVGGDGALAYVFWHWPRRDVDRAEYEDSLREFHGALAGTPGFLTSTTFRVGGLPWLPEATYEDWYVVEGFADLGTLKESAITRAGKPHDSAARRAAGGAAGLMQLVKGPLELDDGPVTWCHKPEGTTYAAFGEQLGAPAWLRQLVLGPQPEFCVGGHVDPHTDAHQATRAAI